MPNRINFSKKSSPTVDRAEAAKFYRSTPWKRVRKLVLQEQPLCVDCLAKGKTTAATEVHHLQDRRENPSLALDLENLVALCRAHHNSRRKDQ